MRDTNIRRAASLGPRGRSSWASRLFDTANHAALVLLGVVTIGPFLYILAGSLTEARWYQRAGVTFNPMHWSLASYRILLGSASIIYDAMRVTIFITLVGTFLSLLCSALMAYGLADRELPGRKVLVFLVFFTMMFGGGMVPFYLVVRGVGLINSPFALIIPMLVGAWYVFMMIKFFDSLPDGILDAARIDGCGEMGIFVRIALPLSKPILATIGLFYAVGYWNEWFWAQIFLSDRQLYPLQMVLYSILNQMMLVTDPSRAVEEMKQQMDTIMPAQVVLRMATIMITVTPIAAVYPFLQKHFVKGVMIGAIKG
ncbi:MAG: carbohydrate ABC transporter permease [Chloroflexi bacterium]|nr:carbohydrate ABC transporter permease [Chloroflexota bacterium]